MTLSIPGLVQRIHAAPLRIVVATTGGGALGLSDLLTEPGASHTVLEAIVPYAAAALDAFLGAPPEHYCHERTARAMAMAAFQRARRWAEAAGQAAGSPVAGIACTASLATDRPKQGPHRLHLGVQTSTYTARHSLELTKGGRRRLEEEQLAGRLILNAVASAAGLAESLDLPLLPGERVQSTRCDAQPAWVELLAGRRDIVRHGPASAGELSSGRRAIFPGAFAPRHSGHRRMAQAAAAQLGCAVEHELSVLNVDKPPLDFAEMEVRLREFAPDETLWFTRAPTFVEKAELFPGATFVVGADTAVRIGQSRYYGSDEACRRAIARLAQLGCRFLVFGRLVQGTFRVLEELSLPPDLQRLCIAVPQEMFREDISSTELRARQEA
jgi:nicotinamide mononucleotide (NMN) deamidase PncC